jgi:flavin reductase (DIM6/NTAB) family NADH-FMN oxidoreductase RutF
VHKINPRHIHRLFYPSVPAILCASLGEIKSGMPVVSYAALSEEPPLLGVSCFPESNTYRIATKTGCFSICILDRKYVRSVEFLGRHTGKNIKDKISEAKLTPKKAERIESYVIEESSAIIECIKVKTIRTGDHRLLIGKVVYCYATEDFEEYWDFKKYRPILYTGMKDGFTLYENDQ